MAPNRKKAEEFILTTMYELESTVSGVEAKLPKNKCKNYLMYENIFKEMSDKEFAALFETLRNKKEALPYYAVNLSGKDIDIATALKVGDKLGLNFFQKIYITDPDTGVKYLSKNEYFIIRTVIRRQSQHLEKGKSVTVNAKVVDVLTGQPVGDSKTCRFSAPELIVLDSLRLDHSINELLNVKGGNVKAYRNAKISMANTGTWTIDEVTKGGHRPTSTLTLKAFLFGMHLENNL